VDYSTDGHPHIRYLHAIEQFRLNIVHRSITSTEMESICSMYTRSPGGRMDIEWQEDGQWYSTVFEKSPEPTVVDGGVDGETVWDMVVTLVGNYMEDV
jgi:hypothetical protein